MADSGGKRKDKTLVVSTPTREGGILQRALLNAAERDGIGYKLVVFPSEKSARNFSRGHITPGAAYEPAPMTCPCCKSTDTTGTKTARVSTICWKCYAIFKELPGGAVQIDECNCGRHDEGCTVKQEEVEA